MEQIFKYKLMQEDAEGNKTLMSEGGVYIREIVNFIKKDGKLFLFLKETSASPQLVPSPVKKTPTKDNPSGWVQELEKRMIEEPLTLQITEEDDILRFIAYTDGINI